MQTSKILFRIVTLTLAATLITACSKEARKTRFLAEADNYFKAGDYDKAKVSYLNVLQLDPQNALAFERIGAMWQDDGAPLRAGAFLAKASELDPKNAQNRIRLARCYVDTGRFGDGTKEALKVLEQAPDNGDAIITLTEAARSKEDIEAAGGTAPEISQKERRFFPPGRRRICFSMGATCLQRATHSSRRSPPIRNHPPPTWRWEICIWSQKDLKQAGEEFKKAADLAPDSIY